MASRAGVRVVGAMFDDELRLRAAQAADPVNVVTGTDGDDVLKARGGGSRPGPRPSKGADLIEGRGGNDDIDSSGGDDVVQGDYGPFDVTTWAGPRSGTDRIKGGAGNDTIWGDGTGDARFTGCAADWVDGGPGDDFIHGDTTGFAYGVSGGNDRLFGGAGNDTIRGDGPSIGRVGSGGADELNGGFGSDFLIGDADSIGFQGAAADDVLDGGAGNDVLVGDGLLEPDAAPGNDRLFGGKGNDRLYGDSPLGVDFERLAGALVDLGELYFAQTGGNDVLDGGEGDDLLVGGFGSDEMTGGNGSDTFLFFPSGRSAYLPEIDRILDFARGFDELDLTRWGLDGVALDTDENGVLGDGDDAVFGDGEGNLVIDLGSATGLADPDTSVLILDGVTSLRLDDLVPLPAQA